MPILNTVPLYELPPSLDICKVYLTTNEGLLALDTALDAIDRLVPEADVQVEALPRFPSVVRDLERATAKQILDELDLLYAPSAERRRIRKKVLDSLAWMREQVERCSLLPTVATTTESGN